MLPAPRLERAHRLVSELRTALDAADLSQVGATVDAGEIPSGARDGIVCVAAPKLRFDGAFGQVQAAYELHVIAGPADDYLAAWERLDIIVQALVEADFNLSDGEPAAYAGMHGEPLPAYTLTLNDLD